MPRQPHRAAGRRDQPDHAGNAFPGRSPGVARDRPVIVPLPGRVRVLERKPLVVCGQHRPRRAALLRIDDDLRCTVDVDGPPGADRHAGLRGQGLQGDALEGRRIAGEPPRLDEGRHHRLHRRDEPVLAQRREGRLPVDALHRGVLAEEEAGALEEQGAEQRHEHEDHQHLDQRQAQGRDTAPAMAQGGARGRQSSGSRTLSYPTTRIRQVPRDRPRSLIIMNSTSYRPTS